MPAEARTLGYCISSPTRFSFLRSVVLCVREGGGRKCVFGAYA